VPFGAAIPVILGLLTVNPQMNFAPCADRRRRFPSMRVVLIPTRGAEQAMITKLNVTSVKVPGQDEALRG
jgi:hypothetical protein